MMRFLGVGGLSWVMWWKRNLMVKGGTVLDG